MRGPQDGYTLTSASGETLRADAVILAVPAFVAETLTRDVVPGVADGLAGIRYVSTGTISLAFRMADIRRPLAGFGLVVPTSEHRPINAVTWSSLKFDNRAPEGYALLRVFFGGSRSPQSMELDDDALLATVRAQLQELMGIEAAPLFQRIYRWRLSNAQYDVGHLERVAALEAGAARRSLPHRQRLSRRRPARLHQAKPGDGRQDPRRAVERGRVSAQIPRERKRALGCGRGLDGLDLLSLRAVAIAERVAARLPQIQDVLGHFTVYAVLAVLLWWALRGAGVRPSLLWALAAAVLYGATDEFHHSFVPNRHPDVF